MNVIMNETILPVKGVVATAKHLAYLAQQRDVDILAKSCQTDNIYVTWHSNKLVCQTDDICHLT